ncbi:hypothetical protein [Halovivax cerinus]|uniref:Uncharacterized protein n=1 Tax=Halovivax cerinus TaxID=1487865 RepID=A0ABD5NLV6_9EURY|nr:hypothetical protein [Halovivax cerinus]
MTHSHSKNTKYDDEEFFAVLLAEFRTGDDWVGTHQVTRYVGCGMQTANRRLLELARTLPIEVYDPKAGDGEVVAPDQIDETARRLLGFRIEPLDPDTAPDSLETEHKTL